MDNYFKFWKQFPKFIFGALFAILLSVLIYGFNSSIEIFKELELLSFDGLFQGVLLIFIIFAVSSLGIRILDLFIAITYKALMLVSKFDFVKALFFKLQLSELLLTEGQLSYKIFVENQDDIISFFYYKSWAQPEGIGKTSELESQFLKISGHVKGLKNKELLNHFSYYSTVTQERAVRDTFSDDVKECYYLLANINLILLLIVINHNLVITAILACIVAILAHTILLPLAKQYKIKLCHFIICGYMDDFTVGEGATMVDRDPYA